MAQFTAVKEKHTTDTQVLVELCQWASRIFGSPLVPVCWAPPKRYTSCLRNETAFATILTTTEYGLKSHQDAPLR